MELIVLQNVNGYKTLPAKVAIHIHVFPLQILIHNINVKLFSFTLKLCHKLGNYMYMIYRLWHKQPHIEEKKLTFFL